MTKAAPRVLSTLEPDGKRRWLHPLPSAGRFLTRRRVVAWALIALFTALPFVRLHGQPALLLDVVHRRFHLFGVTFFPTDTLLLALTLLSAFVAIFLLTALFGRVWCGWACPQTVWLEFVFRPIERLLEGKDGRRVTGARRAAKLAIFALLAFLLANTFLAYFVGVDALSRWMTRPPAEHWSAFVVMAVVTALVLIDFGFFREQMCTLACPYGRFQSVLLDKNSLIIGYDRARGEPRGPIRAAAEPGAPARGDCVDCKLCVRTCPTGIDIREGLQMECIACAQCIDACDAVMEKVGRPHGLIRYASQAGLERGKKRIVRPRVVIYPVVLTALLTALGVLLGARAPLDVTSLRASGTPYRVVDGGAVENLIRLKVTNRDEVAHRYVVAPAVSDPAVRFDGGEPTAEVAALDATTIAVRVTLGQERFDHGLASIRLTVTDDRGQSVVVEHALLGPLFSGSKSSGRGAPGADVEKR